MKRLEDQEKKFKRATKDRNDQGKKFERVSKTKRNTKSVMISGVGRWGWDEGGRVRLPRQKQGPY